MEDRNRERKLVGREKKRAGWRGDRRKKKQRRRKRGEGGLAEKREKQMSKGRKQRSFQNLAGRGGSEGGKISELHRGGVLSGTSIIDF